MVSGTDLKYQGGVHPRVHESPWTMAGRWANVREAGDPLAGARHALSSTRNTELK